MYMEKVLDDWIEECISKGTFANKDDAIEFCIGATLAFCKMFNIKQDTLKDKLTQEESPNNKIFPISIKTLPLHLINTSSKHTIDDLVNLYESHEDCIYISKEESKDKGN